MESPKQSFCGEGAKSKGPRRCPREENKENLYCSVQVKTLFTSFVSCYHVFNFWSNWMYFQVTSLLMTFCAQKFLVLNNQKSSKLRGTDGNRLDNEVIASIQQFQAKERHGFIDVW